MDAIQRLVKHIGIIDLGTNTFNLLVARLEKDGGASFIHKTKRPVKIGEGGIRQGYLTPAAMQRGLETLKEFKEIFKSFGVKQVVALGTSALRDAENTQEFVLEVWNQTGIYINIISGDEEASLIAEGVRQSGMALTGRQLIMDIGGGSTEFIALENGKTLWQKSFDLGAARLLDKFKPSNPITEQEQQAIEAFIEEKLADLWENAGTGIAELIGSSGSFDSFAAMLLESSTDDESIQGTFFVEIPLEPFFDLHQKLLQSTREDRKIMRGLIPMRADMIVLASLLTNTVVRKLKITRIQQCAFALKEGVLEAIKNNQLAWLKSSL